MVPRHADTHTNFLAQTNKRNFIVCLSESARRKHHPDSKPEPNPVDEDRKPNENTGLAVVAANYQTDNNGSQVSIIPSNDANDVNDQSPLSDSPTIWASPDKFPTANAPIHDDPFLAKACTIKGDYRLNVPNLQSSIRGKKVASKGLVSAGHRRET